MDPGKRREVYENAIMRLDQYIEKAPDGTLTLAIDRAKAELDPVVFADLTRSLEETNRKIRAGEFTANDIAAPTFSKIS
jgi:hypothetical protein